MRPRLLAAVFLPCVFFPLAAQTPAASANQTPPPQAAPNPPKQPAATARITGSVFCNDTHRPARGAVVLAQRLPKDGHVDINPGTGMTRVGMDGTYTIGHLQPGDYTIVAFLPGYISPLDDLPINNTNDNDAEMRARLARNGVISVRNNETAHLDATLERGATITGRVLYDDGAPATQVVLNLEDVNAKPASKSARPGNDNIDMPDIDAGTLVRGLFLHQSQGTDDQGNFRISGVKPGTYRLAALPAVTGESSDPSEAIFLGGIIGGVGDVRSIRFYSGDTLHKNAAKKYDLRAGDEVNGIEITIPVYAFHRVEGHLTTLDDRPVVSAGLLLTDTSDDSFVLRAQPSRDGSFIFPQVPAGTYKLAVANAISGTLPENFSENYPAAAPIQPGYLPNMQSLADKTTTVLVKDSDITDLSIQLQNAPPAPNQPTATSVPTAAPQ